MSIRYALNTDSTPYYMRHLGMRLARFIEDGDKPGTGVAGDDAGSNDPAGKHESGNEGDETSQDVEGLKRALAAERASNKTMHQELGAAKSALQKIEDDKLDDLGKANKRAEDAEARAFAAEAKVAVRELADEHGITDSDQIAILAAIPDEETRQNAAKAFKAASDKHQQDPDPKRRFIPKAGSGSNSTGGSGGSVQAGRERWAAKHNKN